MIVDVNAVITGTPDKRIALGYQTMKDTYNESSAEEFFNIYSKENLTDILNNSPSIFSECYKGLNFYKDLVLNENNCIFTRFDNELSKVETYVEENASLMDDNQKEMLTDLLNNMKEFREKYSDVILLASYANEKEDPYFSDDLMDALYKEDSDEAFDIFKSANYPGTKYVYAPYIAGNDNFKLLGQLNESVSNLVKDTCNENLFIESEVFMHRLSESNQYKLDLSKFGNKITRTYVESWLYLNESLEDTINHWLNITQEEAGVILHEDSHDAVNGIFDDIVEAALFDESYAAKKEKAESLKRYAADESIDLLSFEMSYVENSRDSICTGYDMIPDNTTFDEAYRILAETASMSDEDFFESADEDDVDGGLSELSDFYKDDDDEDGDDKSKSGKSNVKAKEDKASKSTASSSASPVKPKAKDLATKVQTMAQDAEVKQMGKAAKRKEKVAAVGRAVKAVAQLPLNVINDIKSQVKALDEKDIERRRAYMVQPGWRKKAFRNAKLAIMYGTAAQANLALVPVLQIVRHFSKKKDRFVREELIRDLATEIKVCEAKIEDAQNNNDQNEKYRLMRIRDKLEHERMRVLFNSKRM